MIQNLLSRVVAATVLGLANLSAHAAPPLDQLNLDRREGSILVSAQPSESALRQFADMGGRLVINLRSADEMTKLEFDEQAAADHFGLRYVQIEVAPDTFSRADVAAYIAAISTAPDAPILLHCASGNRAAAMLTAYSSMHDHTPLGQAMQRGYQLGLKGSMGEAVLRNMLTQPVNIAEHVEPQRMQLDIEKLASFGTRHTLSQTHSPDRGIGAAREWIKHRFEVAALGSNATAAFDVHHIESDGRRIDRPVDVVNVVCTIPGSMPEARDRLYYVLAHYDSRASDVMDADIDAPGANDDGSGVAALIELARALSHAKLDATVVLMATAGEEQGLLGARAHAETLAHANADVRAVLNNDMIGDPTGPNDLADSAHVRVFSEGLLASALHDDLDARTLRSLRQLGAESDAPSRQLARFIAEVARIHATSVQPMLVFRPDRFLRGGDHTPFNDLGFPAVRFTHVFENYDRQHQDVRTEDGVSFGDLPEHVDPAYLANVTRLNAAVLVHLANAPSSPPNPRIIVADLTNDTTLRWDRSPEPDVLGYQIVWRTTTASDWEDMKDVGDVNEATIDLSKDNYFFGLRAYDHEGYLSPVVIPLPSRD